jgi:hypothetical protein
MCPTRRSVETRSLTDLITLLITSTFSFCEPSRVPQRLFDQRMKALEVYYAGTIMLAQLGVLGNLEASLKK